MMPYSEPSKVELAKSITSLLEIIECKTTLIRELISDMPEPELKFKHSVLPYPMDYVTQDIAVYLLELCLNGSIDLSVLEV